MYMRYIKNRGLVSKLIATAVFSSAITLSACGGGGGSSTLNNNGGGGTTPTYEDCFAGTQSFEGISYSFPDTLHNQTSQATGENSIDGGEQKMIANAYCNDGNIEISDSIIESTSCDATHRNEGESCIAYQSCPVAEITQGDFGTQFSFPNQAHGKSQTASNSFEATSDEFPEKIDFGTYKVDEKLTSDCDDGERTQRDYSVLQTDMNCPDGSITYENTTFDFGRQAHNTTFNLNKIDDNDYNLTTSSADFSCDNTVVSYNNNFNQTIDHKELDGELIQATLEQDYSMSKINQDTNTTFYGSTVDDNNNPYNVNYTNLKGENGLVNILMGHIPNQSGHNILITRKNLTGLAYLDFQNKEDGLQDVNVTIDDLLNNDSNIAGTLQEGITLPELQEKMKSLEEGNFEYTNGGLLVYVDGNGGSENRHPLRNENYLERNDHGETRNNTNIFSGVGPNYSFGTPFLRDNNGDNIEVQTHVNFNPIGNYNDGTFNLNQNLIDIIEGIQKLDKSQIPNASYSLIVPISNTSNGNTKNFPFGPLHKGLMGIPTMTRNNNNRINLGTFIYCPGNGTYDNEFDTCR